MSEEDDMKMIDDLVGDKPVTNQRPKKKSPPKRKEITSARTVNVIESFLTRKKRMPTGKELLDVGGDWLAEAGWEKAIAAFAIQKVKRLTIIEGRLFTTAGDMVWVQQSTGSLVPARYREDKELGHVVLP